MILILGGTTEGRAAAAVVDGAGKPFYYSTRYARQEVTTAHGVRLTGGMDAEGMTAFCRTVGIRLLIDAAHPFAVRLHRTVAETSEALQIPVIRWERNDSPADRRWVWCDGYADALARLEVCRPKRLLALTGVNTIAPLRPWWEKHDCWFRILNREESLAAAREQGFPSEKLLFYSGGEEALLRLIEQVRPDALLTKESGDSGDFAQKVEVAERSGLPVFVIRRPPLPDGFYKVYGADGLRLRIDRLLPGFFSLRTGYATGTCAAAAAKAALLTLLGERAGAESEVALPSGERVALPVAAVAWEGKDAVRCTVIKDAGSDPDVTNGCSVVARVELLASGDEGGATAGRPRPASIFIRAGEGVGTVTLPGLGIAVGEPAVNPTPRQMITNELQAVMRQYRLASAVAVTLSVPGGRALAQRTLNPRLGIEGGISIIGTSGLVRPFSHEAFVASLRKAIEVAKATGCDRIVINSGARSERFLRGQYPDLPPQAFIHYGNRIGETLTLANELHIPEVVLGMMIGKAVKLAEGALNTHSAETSLNRTFLKRLARQSGCDEATTRKIDGITLARELWTLFADPVAHPFFTLLLRQCRQQCVPLLPSGRLSLLLIDEQGRTVAMENGN